MLVKGSRSWAWGRDRVLDLGALGEDRWGRSWAGLGDSSPSYSLSSSQNGDETGTWPNNQFDTEMLQAMILASASGKLCQHVCWDERVLEFGGIPQPPCPKTGYQPASPPDLSAGLRGLIILERKARLGTAEELGSLGCPEGSEQGKDPSRKCGE